MTRALPTAAAVLAILLVVGSAGAQSPEDVKDALRIDWKRMEERSGVEGFVVNDSAYRVGLVQIRVMGRDDPGQAPTPALAWVYGNVPARGRTYFRVRVPQGREVVDVVIDSFRLIARDPASESP